MRSQEARKVESKRAGCRYWIFELGSMDLQNCQMAFDGSGVKWCGDGSQTDGSECEWFRGGGETQAPSQLRMVDNAFGFQYLFHRPTLEEGGVRGIARLKPAAPARPCKISSDSHLVGDEQIKRGDLILPYAVVLSLMPERAYVACDGDGDGRGDGDGVVREAPSR
jgi:hypothetical protein